MTSRQRQRSKIVKNAGGEVDPDSLTQDDFEIEMLKGARYANSMGDREGWARKGIVHDTDRRILYDPSVQPTACRGAAPPKTPLTIRLANPRNSLHFNPKDVTVGIVTCGGLCPGLNDVIRNVTRTAIHTYGVRRVVGFRYGFWGLSAKGRHTALELTGDNTASIHRVGGTFLGSSRGPQPAAEMAETLQLMGVNILFTVGGDGTQRGALTIAEECKKRNMDVGVVGIPKTIDNDLSFSHRTFGFETAVEHACHAIEAAYAEAFSAQYGIGIVKVMGRHSGFIATNATLASGRVNLCFIPEVAVSKEKVMELIDIRFRTSDTCVIVVAEGFGQDWVSAADLGTDASGNKKLIDVGLLLKKEVEAYCKKHPVYKEATVKYIDPSYMIRACIPNPSDATFCLALSTLAVHEAMAGATNALISYWYDNFITVPIRLATSLRKEVCVTSKTWRMVREITVDGTTHSDYMKDRLSRRLIQLTQDRERVIRQLSKL